MKTLTKWVIIGITELIFCFWLLGLSANLVSAPSTPKVWLGVFGYLTGLVIIPGTSLIHVATRLYQVRQRQQELKTAFPDDQTSFLQLLD